MHSVILVPGLLCDATVWEQQIAALSPFADVRVAVHGEHDSLAAMADAIVAQAPARFALAGHSMGGRVALEVLRRVPQRVSGLALLDTGYEPLPAGPAGEREAAGRWRLVEIARTAGMRTLGRAWLPGMIHPQRLSDRALIDTVLAMIERQTPELYAAQTRALLQRPDATTLLPQIRCPCLILCGREDTWSPPERHRRMAVLIPGSTYSDIADCGHMSTLERPAAVSSALLSWLRASAGSGAPADGPAHPAVRSA
jgi:pimeloyl-ACP methyl ester carboxylesterase